MVWVLDHMFGDGIGLMPLALKMAKTAGGSPYEQPEFKPNRGGLIIYH